MGKLDEETIELVDQLFDLYDKNRKSYLTIKETVWLLTDVIEMGGEANPEVINHLVNDMDTNKDNKITKKEFMQMYDFKSTLKFRCAYI